MRRCMKPSLAVSRAGPVDPALDRVSFTSMRRPTAMAPLETRQGRSEDGSPGDVAAEAVERRGCGDEERAIVVVTPGEVRRVLGDLDDLAEVGCGIEHVNAAGAAAIDVAGRIHLHPVRGSRPVALGL